MKNKYEFITETKSSNGFNYKRLAEDSSPKIGDILYMFDVDSNVDPLELEVVSEIRRGSVDVIQNYPKSFLESQSSKYGKEIVNEFKPTRASVFISMLYEKI